MNNRTEDIRKLAEWMGWEAFFEDGEYVGVIKPPDKPFYVDWFPFENIQDAWELVEVLNPKKYAIRIEKEEGCFWVKISFINRKGEDQKVIVQKRAASEAICNAVLKLIREESNDSK